MPFKCDVDYIGKVISEETAKHILGFEIVYPFGKNDFDVEIDYLLDGEITIYSPIRKRFISGVVWIVDNKTGERIVRTRFAPTSGRWKMNYIGEVFGTAINRALLK